MISKLPLELLILILTHKNLFQTGDQRSVKKSQQYQELCRVSKQFRDLLQQPFVKFQFLMSYHDNNVRECMVTCIKYDWQDVLSMTCRAANVQDPVRSQAALNDALIYAVCSLKAPSRQANLQLPLPDQYRSQTIPVDVQSDTELPLYGEPQSVMSVLMSLYSQETDPSEVVPRPPRVRRSGRTLMQNAHPSKVDPYLSIQILVAQGANIKTLDNFALRRSCLANHSQLVKLFLEKGASVISRKYECIRTAIKYKHVQILPLILLDVQSVVVAILECSKLNDMVSLQDAFESKFFTQSLTEFNLVEQELWFQEDYLKHPMVLAAKNGSLDVYEYLQPKFNQAFVTNTSLRYAVKFGHLELVRAILKLTQLNFEPAIVIAAQYSQVSILRLILNECRQGFAQIPMNAGHPLVLALRNTNDTQVMDLIMQETGLTWQRITNFYLNEEILRSARQ